MLVAAYDYSEQLFINHDDPTQRYIELNGGNDDLVLENTFKFYESGASDDRTKFGLCSLPYFECTTYSIKGHKVGERVTVTCKAKNAPNNKTTENVKIGDFNLSKVERTNIPHVYKLRGESIFPSATEFSAPTRFYMRYKYMPKNVDFEMGLYPLLKEYLGRDFPPALEVVEPSLEPFETGYEAPVNYNSADYNHHHGKWYFKFDLFAEIVDSDVRPFRTFFLNKDVRYSFYTTKQYDYTEALSILKKQGCMWAEPNEIGATLIRYSFDYVGGNYRMVSNGKGITIQPEETVYLGDSQAPSSLYSWAIAIPRQMVFKSDDGVTQFTLNLLTAALCTKHYAPSLNGLIGLRKKRESLNDGIGWYMSESTLDSLSLRKTIDDAFEVYGFCSRIGRPSGGAPLLDFFHLPESSDYKENFYPQRADLYPQSNNFVYPLKVFSINKKALIGGEDCGKLDYSLRKFKCRDIKYQYRNDEDDIVEDSLIVADKDGNSTYDIRENNYFSGASWANEEVQDFLNNALANEVKKLDHWGMNVEALANPLLQPWDKIEVIDPYSTVNEPLTAFVMSRTITNEQFMRDELNCPIHNN